MTLAAHALVRLDEACDQIGIAVGDNDAVVERVIARASARVASYLGRVLHYRAEIVESVGGYGTPHLVLSAPPVASIASITFDGVAMDADTYSIEDAEAGIVFRRGGWVWTAARNPGVVQGPAPGSEERLITVTYAGGFWTPAQGDPGDAPTGALVLPDEIADATLQLVASMYGRRGGPGADVASESLMGYSVTYRDNRAADGSWTAGLSPDVAAMLSPFRFLLQST